MDREPLVLHRESVRTEWIDYNGHLNVAYYGVVFDHATDTLLDSLGIGEQWARDGSFSTFALESHILYCRELVEGAPILVSTQLLDCDSKRIHYFHRMFHAQDGYLAATLEQISLCVDLTARRGSPFPPEAQERIAALFASHRPLPRPEQAGRRIAIPR